MSGDRSADLLRQISEHYQGNREAERLFAGPGLLERLRTQEILRRHLTGAPARILDVGGGPGTYALWLLEQGYSVDLIDLVPEHVDDAARRFQEHAAHASARVGDARQLEAHDESYDAVLILGPLYHLTERADRVRALAEVQRVLRPGGFAFIAAISRFASMLDGFSRGLIRDPDFVDIMKQELVDGRHRNVPGKDYFTRAYFHRQEELQSEIEDAGLAFHALHAVEGPFWVMGSFNELLEDSQQRELMLEMLRRVESDATLLGASAHWLAIAKRART